MTSGEHTSINDSQELVECGLHSAKARQAEQAFATLLAEASQAGFYGTASLSLIVQDGRIQYLRTSREQMIR